MPKAPRLIAAAAVVALVWAVSFAVDWNGIVEAIQGHPLTQQVQGAILFIKEVVVDALAFVAGWIGRGE